MEYYYWHGVAKVLCNGVMNAEPNPDPSLESTAMDRYDRKMELQLERLRKAEEAALLIEAAYKKKLAKRTQEAFIDRMDQNFRVLFWVVFLCGVGLACVLAKGFQWL